MAVITAKDHLKSHDELLAGFRKHLELIASRQPPPKELLLDEKSRRLEGLEKVLAAAEEARARAIAQYDEKIAGYREQAAALEKDIAAETDALKKAATAGAAPVGKVKGVGKAFSTRLDTAGLTTAKDLADATAKKVATTLEISVDRADKLIGAAKQFIKTKR